MIRYVARASWDPDDYPISRQHIGVYERDAHATYTGLLDQHGVRIWRHAIREPIGFGLGNRSPDATAS